MNNRKYLRPNVNTCKSNRCEFVLEAESGEIYCKLEKFMQVCLFIWFVYCLFIWLCLVICLLFVCLFVYSHILYLAADVDNTDEDLTNCLYQFYSSGDSNLKLDRQVLYEPSAPPLRSTSCVEVKLPIGPNIRIVQVSPEKYCFI